jgi:23S rRNA pseudouridine1911/1915/1917 synthase
VEAGLVRVDGHAAAKPGLILHRGAAVEVELPPVAPDGLVPENIPIEVVWEDAFLAVVNKPAGLVVHPGHGCRTGTLVHALLGRGVPLAPAGGAGRPGIVHRLDRETSGLLLVAKTDAAHRALVAAFAARRIAKTYEALVWGKVSPAEGRIETNIGRSRGDPTRMSVRSPRGRAATTIYRTVEELPGFTRVSIDLVTGRTHQIRVHFMALHHPVVGDTRYGGNPWKSMRDPAKREALRGFHRLALHAQRLSLEHPVSAARLAFTAPRPAELERLLEALRGPS